MTRQGCSTFSTDESNRILDRLAGLEKIITPDQIMQALVATGRSQSFDQWYENLLWEMRQEMTEPRRNRINPRYQAEDVEVGEEEA